MNSITLRLYIVVVLIFAASGFSWVLKLQTEQPDVEMPGWTFDNLPLELGNWRGEPTKLDPEIAKATRADSITDRLYQDDAERVVSMHSAIFKDHNAGVYHNPFNCYRTAGWKKIDEAKETVAVSKDFTLEVSLTTWEKESHRILVVYWYQLGERVLFERFELGAIRWSLGGQTKWPVLTKVMLQTMESSDSRESKALILDFAKLVAQWLNGPEHQKYLAQWRGTR
jgi:EpsI family protein